MTKKAFDKIAEGLREIRDTLTFKVYKRKGQIKAMPWHEAFGNLDDLRTKGISVSQANEIAGSPKIGDMIAQNPDNPDDMWLIAKDFFAKNYDISE